MKKIICLLFGIIVLNISLHAQNGIVVFQTDFGTKDGAVSAMKGVASGVDPNLNPEPPLNTEARREYDNQKREQEMEKQLRLGNMPKFSTAPKPHGP